METMNCSPARVAPLISTERGPTPGPRLREASFADHEQIRSLEAEYGLGTMSYEEWEHLWKGNPAYDEFGEAWPIGWVLESETGRIVGYVGNIPVWHEFQGRKLLAAVTHAWVVDSRYRSYSILLLDCYFSQKNADLFLSTTVNAQSSTAFGAFHSSRVPAGAWDHSIFWITHYPGFTRSWMRTREHSLSEIFSYPLSMGLWLSDMFVRRTANSSWEEPKVESCTGFDDRFEAFWEELRGRNPHLLLGVRSREVLEWHFKYQLLKKEVWILAITSPSGIAAYSVFCRQDNSRFGLKRLRLVDFQSLDRTTGRLQPMLRWALKQCQREGIHMLECIGFGPQEQKALGNLIPHRRRLPSWLYFYQAREDRLARSLASAEVWNPSWFDGDSSL